MFNFDIVDIDKKTRSRLKNEEVYIIIATIAIIFVALTGAALFLGSEKTWLGVVIIMVSALGLAILHSRDLSPASQYCQIVDDANIISAEIMIEGKRGNQAAAVALSVENENHTVSHHKIYFPVVEKTDVNKYTLDLAEGTVYIPYKN